MVLWIFSDNILKRLNEEQTRRLEIFMDDFKHKLLSGRRCGEMVSRSVEMCIGISSIITF